MHNLQRHCLSSSGNAARFALSLRQPTQRRSRVSNAFNQPSVVLPLVAGRLTHTPVKEIQRVHHRAHCQRPPRKNHSFRHLRAHCIPNHVSHFNLQKTRITQRSMPLRWTPAIKPAVAHHLSVRRRNKWRPVGNIWYPEPICSIPIAKTSKPSTMGNRSKNCAVFCQDDAVLFLLRLWFCFNPLPFHFSLRFPDQPDAPR